MTLRQALAGFFAFALFYIGGDVVLDAVGGKRPVLDANLLGRGVAIGGAYIVIMYCLRKKSS